MVLIVEEKGVYEYLDSRKILTAYKKVKSHFQKGSYQQIDLKKRKPKSANFYQFRITKKYRALGYFSDQDTFIVVTISDHQN